MNKHIVVAVAGIATLFLIAAAVPRQTEHWPAIPTGWVNYGKKHADNDKKRARSFYRPKGAYRTDGEFLWMTRKQYIEGDVIKFDDAGLPRVQYESNLSYSVVNLAQFALGVYGKHLNGEDTKDLVIKAADKIVEMQSDDGAFRHDYQYKRYNSNLPYARGWFSALSQGQALSTFARAYTLTGDQKYIEAGDKALAFLQVRHPNGPMTDMSDLDPSLTKYIFFLEYPSKPHVYTLNGFIFTLLGIYDWSQVTGSAEVRDLFDRGVETLVKILPYYDLSTYTSYDIGHITDPALPYQLTRQPYISPDYHKMHIELIHAVYTITGESSFAEAEQRWKGYVK